MVTVIIAAAGQGKRMAASGNKVFLPLVNIPVLLHSILTFSACREIDKLVVVVASDEVEQVENMLSSLIGVKEWQVVVGGSERQYSIANALKVVSSAAEVVLVHDGARPLVTQKCIEEVIKVSLENNAAVVAVPVKDTIKTVDNNGWVTGTPERHTLWAIQTPQGFKTSFLRQAYEQAIQEGYIGTDDASLVERLGIKVKVVLGSYDNLKITTPDDIIIAEALLKERKNNPVNKGCEIK